MLFFSLKRVLAAGIVVAALSPAIVPAAPAPAVVKGESASKSSAATVALLNEAVKSTSITVKGRTYPQLKSPSAAKSSSASCQLGSTMGFDQGAAIDLEGGTHRPTNETWGPDVAVYSPPDPDYVILSFNRTVTSAGGVYNAGTSQMPPNYSFSNSVNYSTATANLHNYVFSLDIPDVIKTNLNAYINNSFSNMQSYAQSLSASSGTIKHHGQVWGAGKYNFNVGHSWYHGYLGGTLICAPAYLHDQAQMEAAMRGWVDNIIKRLPRKVDDSAKSPL